MFIYPWGDFHSLNLGWFLIQFKDWVDKIQEYLDNGGGTSENLANVIAPVFNAANTYSAGEYVLYNNELYKANQSVNPGTWDPDEWNHVLIIDEMGSGGYGIDNVARLMIAGQYSTTFAYQKYGICRYNDKLWMANTDLPAGGEEWNSAHWDEITVGAGLTGLRKSVDTLLTSKIPHLESTGDETDRYADIMQRLNTYGCCVLGSGVFYIKSTIGMPNYTTLSGIGPNTVLQLSDDAAGQVAVNVGSYCLVKDMTIRGNSTNLPYNSYTRGNRKAIALLGDYTDFDTGSYSNNFAKLSNLTITDFNHSGIWANKNDGAASFLAENIDILRCHTGIYIELFSEFHSFTNVRCRYCNIACIMQGGNNIFTGCHFDVNLSNIECDDSQNNLINPAHSTFIGCSFCHPNNNTGHNVWIKGTANGWIFSNCQFWYGIIQFEDTTGIVLTNNIIGGTNNSIIITRCTQVIVADNIFKTQNPTVNLSGTMPAWINNLNPDGEINYQYDYSSLGNVKSIYKATGSLSSYGGEALGHCYAANTWEVSIPLPFVCNGTGHAIITRIVLIGLGSVSDLTELTINVSDSYIRIRNIPYTGNVGDLAFINVMMNYSIT